MGEGEAGPTDKDLGVWTVSSWWAWDVRLVAACYEGRTGIVSW